MDAETFTAVLRLFAFIANGQNSKDSTGAPGDTLQATTLQDVVFTASRIKESILVSPVSVQKFLAPGLTINCAIPGS